MAEIQIVKPGCDDDCDDECGKRGKRGKRGHTGPAGTASGGLLKFSGGVAPANDGEPVVSYLADWGVEVGTVTPFDTAPSYPVAVAHSLRNLATNLFGAVVPSGGSIIFDLLKLGVAVPGFSITYGPGENGIKSVLAGPVAFAIGDTFDIRVTATGTVFGSRDASATIGIE